MLVETNIDMKVNNTVFPCKDENLIQGYTFSQKIKSPP